MTCFVKAWSSALAWYWYWVAWALFTGAVNVEADAVGAIDSVVGVDDFRGARSVFRVAKTLNILKSSFGYLSPLPVSVSASASVMYAPVEATGSGRTSTLKLAVCRGGSRCVVGIV